MSMRSLKKSQEKAESSILFHRALLENYGTRYLLSISINKYADPVFKAYRFYN